MKTVLEYKELFFGSFSETLRQYFHFYVAAKGAASKKIGKLKFARYLLISGINKSIKYGEPVTDIDDSLTDKRLSMYLSGTPISATIRDYYSNHPEISTSSKQQSCEEIGVAFIKSDIAPYVSAADRKELKKDLDKLISEDASMPSSKKDMLLSLLFDTEDDNLFSKAIYDTLLYTIFIDDKKTVETKTVSTEDGKVSLVYQVVRGEISAKSLGLVKPDKEATLSLVLSEVCHYFSVSKYDILSQKREKNVAISRRVAMYILRNVAGFDMLDIQKEFNQHFGIVIHCIQKVKDELNNPESDISKAVREITDNINKAH